MVDYINIQRKEYSDIQTQLGTIHKDIIKGESEIRRAIQLLVEYGGGMYVQSISMKVLNLLQQMDWVMALKIVNSFSLSEEKITDFATFMIDTDIIIN